MRANALIACPTDTLWRFPVLVAQGGALIQHGIDRFGRDDAPPEDLRRFQFSKINQPICRGPGPPASSRCFSHGKATTFFFVLGKHSTAPEDASNCWASLAVFDLIRRFCAGKKIASRAWPSCAP